jgi:hypothetical protein
MEILAEWIEAQRELSAASRELYSLRTLPKAQRTILGRSEYIQQWRLARLRMKAADDHCVTLRRSKRLSPSFDHADGA